MKHNKFKAYLVEHEVKQEKVADVLGISRTALTYKLCGRSQFSIKDVKLIQNAFKLTDKQVKAFFFDE